MPKLILSLDGIAVKEVQLTKSRSTLGRRPYNDIVIDNLAVSGEHAMIQNTGNQMVLKDLGSTNGTYVNGKPIRKQALEHGDRIEIGRYKIEYIEEVSDAAPGAPDKPDVEAAHTINGNVDSTMPLALATAVAPAPPTLGSEAIQGPRVRVLDGPSAGKSLALTKVVSTIGNPSVAVASIIRRANGYDLAHVTGDQAVTVNGTPTGDGVTTVLKHGDRINVGGVQLEFLDH
jgi:pSer/pThr/pTyr-binding forkhead associated (FHA) protein